METRRARPTAPDLPALRRALLDWHRRRGLPAPWRDSGDAYHTLVAAVMAQQTQMSRVLPKYEEFVAAYPTVQALAGAPAADVLRRWAPLGYNLRALRLHRAARRIAAAGAFPSSAAELERVEGIGPCTAAVIASFAFGEPVAAVDTNVLRIVRRLAGAELPDAVARATAQSMVSRRAPGRWNQAMMDLGALVCTSRAPRCDACPLARWCRWPRRRDRAATPRARVQAPFAGSRRYYRGRIVQALREAGAGRSLSMRALLASIPHRDGLTGARLLELVASLERDGLVRVRRGRVGLP